MHIVCKFLFSWALWVICYSYAQSQADQYIAALDTVPEPEKAALLNTICWKLRNVDANLSKDYGLMAVEVAKSTRDDYNLMKAYSFTGVAFRNLGYYEEALNYYSKGLQLALDLDEKEQQCYAYINLANLHIYLERPEEAEKQLNTVRKVVLEINDDNISGYFHLNYGRVMLALGMYEEAINHINHSLGIRVKNGTQSQQSVCKKYIADVYLEMKSYRQAEVSYQEALEIMDQQHDKDLYSATLNGLALAQLNFANYPEATLNATNSLCTAEEVNSILRAKEASETLATIATAQNDYQKAEKYLQDVIGYKDKLYTEDLKRQAERFSFTLQNRELTYEKEKQALQFASEKKRIMIIGIASSSIIALVIIAGASIYVQRRKVAMQKRHLKTVQTQNALLEEKVKERTKELSDKNEALERLSGYKEELTHMIAHDLKNPLNAIICLSEDTLDTHKSHHVHQAGKTMLEIVSNMLDIQKFEEAKMKLKLSHFPLSGAIQEARTQVDMLLKSKSISFHWEVPKTLHVHADRGVVLRIFTNLLTNAIKFSEVGGDIWVKADKNEETGRVEISVKDNGKGIDEKSCPHIFNKYWQAEAKKLGKMQSTGLGLTFCRMAVEAHGGNISVMSKTSQGATFCFDLTPGEEDATAKPNLAHSFDPGSVLENWEITEAEQTALQPIITQLKQVPLYEAGKIMQLINDLDECSQNLTEWKNAMMQATYHWDKARFEKLIGQVSTISKKNHLEETLKN